MYALLQHLPSYLGFSSLGCGVSLHGCSSKAQLLLLTFDEGYRLTAGEGGGHEPLEKPSPPWGMGFSYFGGGVSLHGCSSKAQLLLLNLDMG